MQKQKKKNEKVQMGKQVAQAFNLNIQEVWVWHEGLKFKASWLFSKTLPQTSNILSLSLSLKQSKNENSKQVQIEIGKTS